MDDLELRKAGKLKSVMEWLKYIFGDEPIPSFCKSESFIEHLYELMVRECNLEQKSWCYADFVTTTVNDYEGDLASKGSVINALGLSESTLAANLAAVSKRLFLPALDESNFLLALTDLIMDKDKTTSELGSLTKSLDEGANDLVSAVKLQHRLQALDAELARQNTTDNGHVTKLSHNTSFLQNKALKYKADQKLQETLLSKSGVTSKLTHEKLTSDHGELEALTARLRSTQEELAQFSNLPPDKELAQVKVEVARSELSEIEDELAKLIDTFHL